MNSLKVRKSGMWFALILYLILAVGSVGELVLCYGSDGRIELETAKNGLCDPQSPASDSSPLEPSLEKDTQPFDDRCGPCRDIPIALSRSELYVRKLFSPRLIPVFTVSINVAPSSSEIVNKELSAQYTPVKNATFLSIRSTVLLI